MSITLLRAFATTFFLSVACLCAATTAGEDVYFSSRVVDLELTGGQFPPAPPDNTRIVNQRYILNMQPFMPPQVVLDGPGEAYVRTPGTIPDAWIRWDDWQFAAKAPAGRELSGTIYLVDSQGTPAKPLRFKMNAAKGTAESRPRFLEARYERYEFLASRGLPGAAWFRHEAMRTAVELNGLAPSGPRLTPRNAGMARVTVERSLDLFTGQRAISENLALDRIADGATFEGRATVAVDGLTGITIAEIDWKAKLPAQPPTLDALAAFVPADQHAVFFPSFGALATFVDRFRDLDTTMLQAFLPTSGDRDVLGRYQRQLGVSLDGAARLVGGSLIQSVAITGGDPYFATGADVTMIFETKQPELLRDAFVASMRASLANVPGAKPREGKFGETSYQGFASDDRRASGYVAVLPGAVILTNSPAQVARLDRVRSGGKSLASLDEFAVFRDRYRAGAAEETAYVFLSDATIRRWCGPRWRIGAMRRARALAELAEIQAGLAGELVEGKVEERGMPTPKSSIELGDVRVTSRGPVSSIYNSLEFATPIAELPLDLVTSFEVEAYNRWRTEYERQWRWAFDPIGVRLDLRGNRIAADMTILPLVAATQYRDLVTLTRGAPIPAGAGERHGALLHMVLGLNRDAQPVKMFSDFAAGALKTGSAMEWLGATVSIYVDDSPFWQELQQKQAELSTAEFEAWGRKNAHRLPLALRLDVTNGEKAGEFLKALRAYIEPFLKPYATLEDREHRGRKYVRVAATPAGESLFVDRFALHVTNLDDAILVTFAEETVRRAIDRKLDAVSPPDGGKKVAADPLAGRNAGLEVDGRVFAWASRFGSMNAVPEAQRASWENLLILNEWKRIFPDHDPLAVHQQLWGVRLACPAGGEYRWNETLKSFESSTAGHPFQPKPLAAAPAAPLDRASLRLTFEEQGLRVEGQLDGVRKPTAK